MAARRQNPDDYGPYLEAMGHGMPPHGGFAIGLERWVARLLEHPIRHPVPSGYPSDFSLRKLSN
ncbi:amino acid--tRNA ligase-related protein [Rhodococcus erythropolis]|uniref:Amino acid--tRNA ligase-related protein n=1 Tax=Rhodococcus erythropolis TaxID=1833 RepID=A0AAX3ZZM8_RHOER|nr:amino acid--tRNA ligase-related protein [Rhodococcus erythropolis]WMN02129.1 amino acid--tRNA ligase-related protein [Rhodococcus erythropolis]